MEETITFKKYRHSIEELLKPLEEYNPELRFDMDHGINTSIVLDPNHNISIEDLKKFEEHIGKPVTVRTQDNDLLLMIFD